MGSSNGIGIKINMLSLYNLLKKHLKSKNYYLHKYWSFYGKHLDDKLKCFSFYLVDCRNIIKPKNKITYIMDILFTYITRKGQKNKYSLLCVGMVEIFG